MKIIVANLKMQMNLLEIIQYQNELKKVLNGNPPVIICPQYPYLEYFKSSYNSIGAQNVSQFMQGAYTGEVSARDLASIDVGYVLVGHSERRRYFNENNDVIIAKINNVLEYDMVPIFFVGESKKSDEKKNRSILEEQIMEVFNKIDPTKINNIIIAYEPFWSTGSGELPTTEEIKNNITFIKDFVKKNFRATPAVLYGGSVNEFNVSELMHIECCDGFVIGGSASNPKEFITILKLAEAEKDY